MRHDEPLTLPVVLARLRLSAVSRARTTILMSLLAAGFAVTIVLTVFGRGSGPLSPASGGRSAVGVQVLLAFAIMCAVAMVIVALTARPRPAQRPSRRLTWRSLAERIGATYVPQPDDSFIAAFQYLPGVTKSAKAKHLLRGTLEVDGHPPRGFVAFQSTYLVNTGQVAIPVSHSIYVTEAPEWPTVEVSPRNTASKVLRRLRPARELVLENSYFNRTMKVFSPNADFGVLLLSPELQLFLVQKKDVRWRIGSHRVALIYKGGMKLSHVEDSLARLRAFWERVPPELEAWEDPHPHTV